MKTESPLAGRDTPMELSPVHFVSGRSIVPPFPSDTQRALFGMGCFWGAEKCFWPVPGVYSTAVGYGGGVTPNPLYREVCSGRTAHNELVLVVYYPRQVGYPQLLKIFWENHDPTQGMRQGNDHGTQYRSGIYCFDQQQQEAAVASREQAAVQLAGRGYGPITTEILPAPDFYYAEEYHQQYLARNPQGYCGLGGTGIVMPP